MLYLTKLNLIEEGEKIRELYLSGLSSSEIAKEYSIHSKTIRRYLKRLGIIPFNRRQAAIRHFQRQTTSARHFPPRRDIASEKVAHLYLNEKMTVPEIAKSLNCSDTVIYRRLRSKQLALSKEIFRDRKCGENASGWRGGYRIHPSGYIEKWVAPYKYKREHIIIWEETHGMLLPKGWVVHHLNGVKDDNRPENLIAMPTRKHNNVLLEKARRIKELEAENRILRRELEDSGPESQR